MTEIVAGGSDPHIVHFVVLDDDLHSAFRTVSRDRAETARRVLTEAFGHGRVSMTSFGESDLDEFRRTVAIWAADPRLQDPRR